MKATISQLMDGELSAAEAAGSLAALREEGEARDAWRTYHVISDALRDSRMLSQDFAGRMAARLAAEPTVVAPAAAQLTADAERGRHRFVTAAIAASVAAAALVAAVYLLPQGTERTAPPLAQAPQVKPSTAPAEVASVPLPAAANDYLLAHQSYSPRNLLQGVAPYVRTVSEEAPASRP